MKSAAALHLSAEACSIAMLPQRARLSGVFLHGSESSENNSVFETHIERENADVYMVALRAPDGRLIGYYEKHESRIPHGETKKAQIEKAKTSYDN